MDGSHHSQENPDGANPESEGAEQQPSQGSVKLRKEKKSKKKPNKGSQRPSERQSQAEEEPEEGEKNDWVPNVFTNMFGGDGRPPEEQEEDRKKGRRKQEEQEENG